MVKSLGAGGNLEAGLTVAPGVALTGSDKRFLFSGVSSESKDEVGLCLGVLCDLDLALALALADLVAAM